MLFVDGIIFTKKFCLLRKAYVDISNCFLYKKDKKQEYYTGQDIKFFKNSICCGFI